MTTDATSRMIEVNGLRLNVYEQGDGPPVLLLHGFPDSAQGWRKQLPELAAAGLRVIAPDLRGFGESDKPQEVGAYALSTVMSDVVGLLDALGVGRVRVVGHDWGAAVAWGMAALLPERVDRLVAVSVGHPNCFWAGGMRQREMSWYMLFFQFPGVAEEALRHDGWRLLRDLLRDEGDIDRYIADLGRPGALTAGLNWYRANSRPEAFWSGERAPFPPVSCPTLGIAGDRDHFLAPEQFECSGEHVLGSWRFEQIADAGHWLALEQPQRLNELLVSFLTD